MSKLEHPKRGQAIAVMMPNPLDASVWRCAAEVAQLAGDESRGSECLTEALLFGAEVSPFPTKAVPHG